MKLLSLPEFCFFLRQALVVMAGAFIFEAAAELVAACKRLWAGSVAVCHQLAVGTASAYLHRQLHFFCIYWRKYAEIDIFLALIISLKIYSHPSSKTES